MCSCSLLRTACHMGSRCYKSANHWRQGKREDIRHQLLKIDHNSFEMSMLQCNLIMKRTICATIRFFDISSVIKLLGFQGGEKNYESRLHHSTESKFFLLGERVCFWFWRMWFFNWLKYWCFNCLLAKGTSHCFSLLVGLDHYRIIALGAVEFVRHGVFNYIRRPEVESFN